MVVGMGDILPEIDLVTDVGGLDRQDAPAAAALLGQLRKDVYELHSGAEITAQPSTIEAGASTKVTLAWKALYKGAETEPVSTKVTNKAGETVSADANETKDVTLTADETYTVETVIVDGITKTASVKVVAVNAMYFGGSAAEALDGAGVTALAKQGIKRAAAGDYGVTVKNGDYLWLCVPDAMTISKVKSGGFDVPMEAAKAVSVTGKGGYKCYRSSSKLTAQTVNITIV